MVDKVHTTAKVNGPLFEGITWAGVAITACFVLFRLWVRRTTMKKFLWDDFLVGLSWFCLLLNTALQQSQLEHIYELFAVQAGEMLPDLDWWNGQTKLLHHVVAFNTLFYTGLWAIKISFMIFFRLLEGGVTNHRYWWWTVLVITVISWVVCIADIQWECSVLDALNNPIRYMECGLPDKVKFQQLTFQVNCALDVATDLMILSVPVALLWNRHINIKKKLILMGLFSMTVLIMAVSLIRVTVVSSKDKPSDFTWLYFWSNIEHIMALVVSSLASFRQLYMSKQPANTNGRPSQPSENTLPSFVQKLSPNKSSSSEVDSVKLSGLSSTTRRIS